MRPEADEVNRYQTKKQPSPPSSGNSSGGSSRFALSLLLIMMIAGAGAWMFYEQHQQLEGLRAENQAAYDYMNQSKLIMARFEGKLSATGEEMEATDMSTQETLVFLDSEMRKLWAVSNDRNKKWIKENEARVEGLKAQSQADQKRLAGSLDELNGALASMQKNLDSLADLVAQASSEAAITRDEMEQRWVDVEDSMQRFDVLQSSIADNQDAIQSIDQSRQQSTGRLVKIEQQVNQLQIDVQALLDRPTGEYDVKVSGGSP